MIDGRLYVAVRDAGVHSAWAHIAVYDTSTLDLLEDHNIAASAGYAVPEGVAWKDDYFWVVFGGTGGGIDNMNVSAVVTYDSDWNEAGSYELVLADVSQFPVSGTVLMYPTDEVRSVNASSTTTVFSHQAVFGILTHSNGAAGSKRPESEEGASIPDGPRFLVRRPG